MPQNVTNWNDIQSTSSSEETTEKLKSTTSTHDLNLTFMKETLSWIKATQHCKANGLIMASNESEIHNWLLKNNATDHIWLGKYEGYTEWAYIKGCFDVAINQSDQPSIAKQNHKSVCQTLCKEQKYFGVKDNVCICLKDISEFSKCRCNEATCATIWEHMLKRYSFDGGNCHNTACQCIDINACKKDNFERKYSDCDTNYYVICDDGHELKFTAENQQKAAIECRTRGSFIKWFTGNDCPLHVESQLWTSGRRELHTSVLYKYSDIEVTRLQKCYSINLSEVKNNTADNCKKKQKRFFCRKENLDDRLRPADILLPPTDEENKSFATNGNDTVKPTIPLDRETATQPKEISSATNGNGTAKPTIPLDRETVNQPKDTSSAIGAAIGSIVAGMIVIAVIIVSGVFIKRRIMQKDKQSNLTVNDQEIPVSIQSAAVSNSTHNLQNPMSESIRADRISSDRATFTVPNADRNMPSNYGLAKPTESNFDTANYSFAKPIETEGDYVYNSDYDHLNSPLKQNVDSDYSLSGHMMITNSDKVGTYDRIKSFERNTDLSSDSNSNYDHLPSNTGTDPTYDVSGNVIHDDSDKYDHLPSNFKHTTTNDYQSTNDILAGDSTDNYDHFVLKQSEAI